MKQTKDLKQVILQQAGALFQEQGYKATSIKQIAKASGCTTAALYYYFEDGKSEILKAVIQSYERGEDVLAGISDCSSLPEYMEKLTGTLVERLPILADQIGWLLVELSSLTEEEKQPIQARILNIHRVLTDQLCCFFEDRETAEGAAWVIFNSFFGYQQVFYRAEIGRQADMDADRYGRFLSKMIINLNTPIRSQEKFPAALLDD